MIVWMRSPDAQEAKNAVQEFLFTYRRTESSEVLRCAKSGAQFEVSFEPTLPHSVHMTDHQAILKIESRGVETTVRFHSCVLPSPEFRRLPRLALP